MKATQIRKIKVLFINNVLDKIGGAEKNFRDIVLNIDRSKFIPYVLAFGGGELATKLQNHGIPVEINGVSKLFSIYALNKGIELYRFLKKEKIQIVVTYHHDPDIWGGLTAKLAGIPVIISSRRDMGYQLRKSHIYFYRIFSFLFSSFISVSDAVKKEIETREWIKHQKITTIHNGINPVPHSKTYNIKDIEVEFGIDSSKVIIGMLAAFRPIKGQHYLVEAGSVIIEKHKNIQIIMVGYNATKPCSSFFYTVKKRVGELGLQDYFIFAGNQQNTPRLLSIFDILVVPSINEGFSNAILEAMAAGKPVIASNVGGNPEAVLHKKTGLLFKPGDSQALAESLLRLIENKNLRESLGKEGQQRVKQNFLIDKMIQQNEDLYQYYLYKPNIKKISMLWVEKMKTYYVKKSIKILLSYILYYCGISRIYGKYSRTGLKVLAYHSIDKITLRPLEIEQDPENFEQQMLYLKNNYHILSLAQFIQYKNSGQKHPHISVLITFDDGYRDNYTNAYPVLKKLNIPAVIFLAIDPIEKNIPLFYDALRYAVLNTKRKILDLVDWGLARYVLYDNELFLAKIINEITRYNKNLNSKKQLEFMDIIFQRLSISKESFVNTRPYLSWDEVKEISQNGIEFGAHTMNHRSLGHTSIEEIKSELSGSKKIIETYTGKKVVSFAYPFGGPGDYSSAVPDILNESGFECAFMLTRESNGCYRIGRKMVDSHMTTKFNRKFCRALFGCEMVNIF